MQGIFYFILLYFIGIFLDDWRWHEFIFLPRDVNLLNILNLWTFEPLQQILPDCI